MVNPETLVELKNALEQENDRLVQGLSSIAKLSPDGEKWEIKFPNFQVGESDSHGQKEEEADEVEEYEYRISTEHSLESRLLEVKKAIQRIHTREYGICKKCGKEIELARLKANPAAEFHLACNK